MSDIKRWIAYLFSYTNGVKGRGAGFARLETRGDSFKIEVFPEISDSRGLKMKLFFACKQPGRIKGIYIGDASFKAGKSEFVYTSAADNIGNSGIMAEELEGLLMYYSDEFYIASEWNDSKIISGNLRAITEDENNALEPQNIFEAETEPEIEYEAEYEVSIEPDFVFEAETESEPEPAFEAADDIKFEFETEAENKPEPVKLEAQYIQTTSVENKASSDRNAGARFDKLLAIYPKLFPFNDDEYIDSVRIDLGVLARLSEKEWFTKDKRRLKLEKNSFILHGFYRYRHLLLVKRKKDGRYLLLVPGMYYPKEQSFAEMFGFNEFKCVRSREPGVGEFGYWSIDLTD